MKIIDAKWTRNGNLLTLLCDCGHEFEHRCDRWWPVCPSCGLKEHLAKIRKAYKESNGQ